MLWVNQYAGFGVPIPGGNDSFSKLLLHCEGADAGTTFTDSSGLAHVVTVHGGAQLDTAQKKFDAASALFNGTDAFLSLDGSADFGFGAGDFTIDFWLRPNLLATIQALYDARPSGGGGIYPDLFIDASNKVYFVVNGVIRITSTTAVALATWYHIALARSGTSTKLFMNGAQEGATYSDSNNYLIGAGAPSIGASQPLSFMFNGWIDELRVSKGIARWTANFTPPASRYN